MKNVITYILVFARAFWWLLFGTQRKKLKKVWLVYQVGGIRLCWYYMVGRFNAKVLSYDPFRNQLSDSQSKYILEKFTYKPLFSIVVPVYKVACEWLDECISSVVNQHYIKWELILVDDSSQKDDLTQLINSWVSQDNRIRSYCLVKNLGIAGATNFGIRQAKGQFIAFLDHDDELTADALTWVTYALNKNPDALWLYSDEDLISMAGKCHHPHFKPDFSPEFLLSNMFTCHLSVYSSEMLAKVGHLRDGFDGSQDHDLALRLSEIIPKEKIIHIPRVLYHWREVLCSTAMGIEAKPKAPSAGRKAVAEALQRRNLKGEVSSYELCSTIYQIKFEPSEFPKISVIIPTKNGLSLIKKCIDSVRRCTNYPNFEIILINNQSDDTAFLEYIKREQSLNRIKVLNYDKPFNHSDMNNIAADSVDSEFIVLMNNDIEIISDQWLEQLLATIQIDESVAVAGGLLLYPDGIVQHGGIILGLNGTAGHANKYIHGKSPGYLGRIQALQEVSGITAALAIIRRSSFQLVIGFNANRYPTLYNDVDLCIRLRKEGYRCIYNPMVRAIHYETKTRPVNIEEFVYKQRLGSDYAEILNRDPFYNPNLALNNEQFHGFREFPVENQIQELANIPEWYLA
ncbi:MAG: glycosyltransferase [Planctomycetota bacterium]|nr:glycosyltransferase [Planctomycetota bacterium]